MRKETEGDGAATKEKIVKQNLGNHVLKCAILTFFCFSFTLALFFYFCILMMEGFSGKAN